MLKNSTFLDDAAPKVAPENNFVILTKIKDLVSTYITKPFLILLFFTFGNCPLPPWYLYYNLNLLLFI